MIYSTPDKDKYFNPSGSSLTVVFEILAHEKQHCWGNGDVNQISTEWHALHG